MNLPMRKRVRILFPEEPAAVGAQGEAESVFEVVSRRTESTKHFHLGNGSFAAVSYGMPVHELDADGAWQDIDNRLGDSGSDYATPDAKVKFAKKIPGNEFLFSLQEGNAKLTVSLAGAAKKTEGRVVEENAALPEDATELQKKATLANLSSRIVYADVLSGVDLEYVVTPTAIKENIIVKERAASYHYVFSLDLNNLTPIIAADGGIALQNGDGETVFAIPRGTMWDAAGDVSDGVTYTLAPTGATGKYTLTVTADAAWINEEGRAFPVTVDPPIMTDGGNVTDYTVDKEYETETEGASLFVSKYEYSFIKFGTLPTVPDGAVITEAKITLYSVSAPRNFSAHVSKIEGAWNGIDTPIAEFYMDSDTVPESGVFSFIVTPAAKEWYAGSANNGIVIDTDETGEDYARIASSAYATAANRPYLTVYYLDTNGIEGHYAYNTQSAGNFAGSVNLFTGRLTGQIAPIGAQDALLGYAPVLTYNYGYFQNLGSHWMLDSDQSVLYDALSGMGYYVYIDADGTEHYLDENDDGTKWYDEENLGLTLTETSTGTLLADEGGNPTFL